jgi:hypothetical protein
MKEKNGKTAKEKVQELYEDAIAVPHNGGYRIEIPGESPITRVHATEKAAWERAVRNVAPRKAAKKALRQHSSIERS